MRKNAPEKHGERGDLISKPDSIAVLAINSDERRLVDNIRFTLYILGSVGFYFEH